VAKCPMTLRNPSVPIIPLLHPASLFASHPCLP
jgi:hypothetical protein